MPDILALPVKFGDFSISLMVSGLGQDVNLLESPPTDKSEDRNPVSRRPFYLRAVSAGRAVPPCIPLLRPQ
jgi:hypothetical protein